jgi:hypothetical protein
MLSKTFLALLSRHITIAEMQHDPSVSDLPFGGVNVVMCGGSRQFPPVAQVHATRYITLAGQETHRICYLDGQYTKNSRP